MPDGSGRSLGGLPLRGRGRAAEIAGLVAACLAVAAVSLVLPWSLAFDPWSWVVWGRETGRFELDTAGGPSWKPLAVVATTVFSFAGGAAPALWLAVGRAGGLLAVAGAAVLAGCLAGGAVLAGRLAGGAAAATAALTMALSNWWFFNSALGNSEGLLAAAALWAVVAHLHGRWRAALALGCAAALLRPEPWPFLGLYALWLWRTRREPLGALARVLLPVPLLWFGPDVLGAGGALGASDAARAPASPSSAVNADIPALAVLIDFAQIVTLPVLIVATAGAALSGGPGRVPSRAAPGSAPDSVPSGAAPSAGCVRLLAAGALAWVALVAVMTQAGYPGNPRYNVVPAAFACVLAGVGIARVARPRPRAAGAAGLAALTLVFTAADLRDQAGELGDRAERRTSLNRLVERVGGPEAVKACARPRTNQPMKAMLAWRLDHPMAAMAARPVPPAAVFQAPPGYDGGPRLPRAGSGFIAVAGEAEWTLVASCATGRLRPSAGRSGP